MDWIRKNPHLLTLIVLALLLLGGSAVIGLNARSFNEKFTDVTSPAPVPPSKIPALDYSALDRAQTELDRPAQWNPIKDNDPQRPGFVYPFVPGLYSVTDGKPQKSGQGSHHKDRLTQESIPDSWFIQYGLPVTDPGVPLQDLDKDGFLAEDEWRGQSEHRRPQKHRSEER